MARRRRKAATLFASTLEAQAATLTTLGVRVPQLVGGTMAMAERHRMVAEKAAAAAESAGATAWALGRLMLDPSAFRSPSALTAGLLEVASAAAEPYHTRVKANAKRLSKARRRSPKRSGRG